MKRRLSKATLWVLALASGLLNSSPLWAATTYYWINSSPGGGGYASSANWAPTTVPANPNAYAWVTNGGTVNCNGVFTNGQLYVAPLNGNTGYFNLTGGSLWIATNNLWLGGSASNVGTNSYGAFTMSGGTLTVEKNGVKDGLILGQATNSTGVFTISNGVANFFGGIEIGFYGFGAFNVHGGTVVASSWFQPGRGQNGPLGSGVFNQTGGTLYILHNANNENNNTRGLYFAQAGTNGVANLSGGTLYCNRIAFSSGANALKEQLNVSGGDLYIGSDGISGAKANATSVNISGGTFHTLDMVAAVPAYPGDISSVLSDGADWTWSGQSVNLTTTIADLGGVGYVTFAPEPGRTITLNNPWSGTGSFVLNGPGTVAMAAVNTYTGNTTLQQGTLALVGTGALPNSPQLLLAGGATLDLSGLSSTFVLGTGQTLSNSSAPARLHGDLNTGSGSVALLYTSGTPAFTVTGGVLSLTTNTGFQVNNTGTALTAGSYKLFAAATGGVVSGVGLPAVTVAGGGVTSGQYTSLGVLGSELYLIVTNDRPPVIASSVTNSVLLGSTWQLALTNLARLAGWSDPDGDPVSLSSVGPLSVDGAKVTNDATYVYYNGQLASDDYFQYTITDGKLTASGLVYLKASNVPAVVPSEAAHVLSLNGPWRFYFERLATYYTGSTPNIAIVDSSEPFQRLDYVEGAGWTNLAVPGNWEMAGFSPATYYVPDTTSGLYRKWFEVPASWQGRQVYLTLDGVQDSAQVWVNGQPALVNEPSWGISNYHESGWTPFQVNLTPLVNFGTTNLLAIRVVKKTPSADLDTGDYFLLGGIYRPVTLYSIPFTNFAEVRVETHLLPNHQAEVDVSADVTQGEASTAVSLLLDGVEMVTNAINGKAVFTQLISQPRLWSAEFPNLYALTLQLKDAAGQVTETVSNRIGIRELSITNGVLLLNGEPVKFAGVCNHDSTATVGNAMGPAEWRRDLLLMKAANINAIRTTHYPFGAGFYDLCDELGMYVADELPYCWVSSVGDPTMQPAFEQRARETIRRDRNHPCVVLWAIGNENSAGANLQVVADLVKALDPTRPRLVSTFAASKYNVELSDRHYPSPALMASDGAAASTTGYPYVYMEQPNTWDVRLAADAGMWERWGLAQQRVWDVCLQYDTIAGTFPFEWSDRAVADPNDNASYTQYQGTGVQLLYFFPNTGIHLLKLKGMTDGFRNARPNVYEAQMIYSPVQLSNVLTVASGQVSFPVRNLYSFTDLSCLTMAWKLDRGALTLASGNAQASLPPRSAGNVQLSLPAEALAYADTLRVDFIHPDGRDIVAHQFTLTNTAAASQFNPALPAGLPIPTLNLITRKTVSDPNYWNKVLRYPASLAGVVLTPPNATNLAQLQALSATVMGGTNGTQVLGQLQAQYANNQFSYSLQWSAGSWEVQEVGWTFQMPSACDHFSWDRAARWTVYSPLNIARATGTATPDSANADYTRMDLPNAFDFNSTKYDCNWASLTTAAGTGLRVEFDPQQRFHCRAGGANNGYVLFVNQQVSVGNDFTTPVVPDLILTLNAGSNLQGSFRVGSEVSSNLVSGITDLSTMPPTSGGGSPFGLLFNGFTNDSYSVWSSTNLADWTWEGAATEVHPGQYQFLDPAWTNAPSRFYRVSKP
jgi:autotransporter-associated beta strand protein